MRCTRNRLRMHSRSRPRRSQSNPDNTISSAATPFSRRGRALVGTRDRLLLVDGARTGGCVRYRRVLSAV
eukprot:8514910-Pyramimonas_sp.AAC.1